MSSIDDTLTTLDAQMKRCPKCSHKTWPGTEHHRGYCPYCQKKCDGRIEEPQEAPRG